MYMREEIVLEEIDAGTHSSSIFNHPQVPKDFCGPPLAFLRQLSSRFALREARSAITSRSRAAPPQDNGTRREARAERE